MITGNVITQRQAATRVKRGVQLLDEFSPGWEKKINLDVFDLSRGDMCVLGQTHQGFTIGLQKIANKAIKKHLGRHLKIDDDSGVIDAIHYGFDLDSGDYDYGRSNEAYEIVGQQWVRVISERQAASKRRKK